MQNEVEEGLVVMTDYEKMHKIVKQGLKVVTVAVQDVDSMKLLMMAYVNREALLYALQNDRATFWSTSRNKLWPKGDESGNVLDLVDVLTDCRQVFFLFLVKLRKGGVCHTKNEDGENRISCFYRSLFSDKEGKTLTILKEEKSC